MQNRTPEICVIILTYNTKDLTLECLDKLRKSINFLNKPVEVIVVENGTDGTGEIVKKKYKWVKLVEPSENTGFARGNNLGVRSSSQKAKYYLFLNTDALIKPETLKKAVDFVEGKGDCDVLGCKLILGNGKMQPSAGYLPAPLNTAFWMWGLDRFSGRPVHPKNRNFFAGDREVGWVMGAFLFMKREVFEKTKGFDETFFMYMEEVDWCKRIREAGFKIWYTPAFAITHLDKASSGFDPTKALTREIQGLNYYLKKYYPTSYFLMRIIIKTGVMMRILAFGLKGDRRAKIYTDILNLL